MHPLWSFSVVYSSGLLSGKHLRASLISGNRTRHQWLYWTSVPSACICPLSPPGIPFLLPPFFLNAELRRWVTDGSRKHEPLLFSASLAPSFPITCSCHVEEDFLFPLLSGAVPLNYILNCLQLWFTIQMYSESYETILSAYEGDKCEV